MANVKEKDRWMDERIKAKEWWTYKDDDRKRESGRRE
jgi:hypothetical protein